MFHFSNHFSFASLVLVRATFDSRYEFLEEGMNLCQIMELCPGGDLQVPAFRCSHMVYVLLGFEV